MDGKIKDFSVGTKVVVNGFEKADSSYRQRLLSMGITPGVELEIVKFAPLGDPVELSLRGYKLSLRRDEADVLIVKEVKNG